MKILPKVPNMRWGALMNKAPTNNKVNDLNKIFPHNGKWHTVFEEKDHTYIDGKNHLEKRQRVLDISASILKSNQYPLN